MKIFLHVILSITAVFTIGCDFGSGDIEDPVTRCNPCSTFSTGYTTIPAYTSYVCQKEENETILELKCACEADFDTTNFSSLEDSTYLSGIDSIALFCENEDIIFPSMPNLVSLSYFGTKIPRSIGKTATLKKLSLQDLRAMDNFPEELYGCTELETLRLSAIPDEQFEVDRFLKLKELIVLNSTSSGSFDKMLPSSIEKLEINNIGINDSLTKLNFKNTTPLLNLKTLIIEPELASVPSSILVQSNLEFLSIQASIPDAIGNLTNLTHLHMRFQSSKINSIPNTMSDLVNLEELKLDYNAISSINSWIGNLTKLQHLNMGFNEITSIDNSIGNLTELNYLDLRFNQLTELPQEIMNLNDTLKNLHLEGNNFSDQAKNDIRTLLPNVSISF